MVTTMWKVLPLLWRNNEKSTAPLRPELIVYNERQSLTFIIVLDSRPLFILQSQRYELLYHSLYMYYQQSTCHTH